jgi:biopolymer transport protein ExbB
VFAAAVRKWGKPAVEVEQAVLDEGERIANALRRYLRVLNGVSTVSPLLGLLGTVWGMIQAFNVIATSPAMGRAEMLAGGISVALITTAAGLLVAIPALIFYLYFVGRVDSLIMEIDQHAQDVVNLISFEALEESTSARIPMQRRKAA